MQFDHIAVSGRTLEEAAAHVEAALGVALQKGGEHARFQTHNRLLGLEDGLYLEALAVMPGAPAMDQPRMFGIDKFDAAPRLTNWICSCDDLDAVLAALPEGFGVATDVTRGDLRWRMAVPEAGFLPFDNCAPAFIQWQGDLHPSAMLAPSGCRLEKLTIRHPQAADLQALLSPHLADARLQFETGEPGLQAAFQTPHGPKTLA